MVRTFKGLYPRIYDFDNLWLAWRRARRGGKRAPSCTSGADNPDRIFTLGERHDKHRTMV